MIFGLPEDEARWVKTRSRSTEKKAIRGGQREVIPPLSQSAIAMSPSGGIPARSGTSSGSATVTLYTNTAGTLAATSPAITVTAYNQSLSAVAGSTYIHLKREFLSGTWCVDFEDCG